MFCGVCAAGEKEKARRKQKNDWQKNQTPGALGFDFSAGHFSAFSGPRFRQNSERRAG
jgi:hypothetical protein